DDEVGVGLFDAHLGECLDEEDQALERHVGAGGGHDPAGHDGHRGVRREQVGVGADVDDVDAVLAHAEVVGDLVAGGAGDGEHGGQAAGDPLLHPGERVPAADRVPAPAAVGGVEFELPVDGGGGGGRGCVGGAGVVG